jgi:hypothetical protein
VPPVRRPILFAVLLAGGCPQAPSDPVPVVAPDSPAAPEPDVYGPHEVAAISAASGNTCLLSRDGGVQCFGSRFGFPLTEAPEGPLTAISAGHDNACAVRADGTVACWGNKTTPLKEAPAGEGFSEVAVGNGYACARTTTGAVTCAGGYDSSARVVPEGAYTQIAVGDKAGCGLRADGAAVCWGQRESNPGAAPADRALTAVAVGLKLACGLDTAGEIVCWGPEAASVAGPPAGPHTAIATAGYFACALGEDREVRCWGRGDPEQLEAPPGPFTQISVSQTHACALRPEGVLWCWGSGAGARPPASHLRADPALAARFGYEHDAIDLLARWSTERFVITKGGQGSVTFTNALASDGTLRFLDVVDMQMTADDIDLGFDARHSAKPPFGLLRLSSSGDPTKARYWDTMAVQVSDDGRSATWSVEPSEGGEAAVSAPLAWWHSAARIVTTMPQQRGASVELSWLDPDGQHSDPQAIVGIGPGNIRCSGLEERTYGGRVVRTWAYTAFGGSMSDERFWVDEDRRLVEIHGGDAFLELVRADLVPATP